MMQAKSKWGLLIVRCVRILPWNWHKLSVDTFRVVRGNSFLCAYISKPNASVDNSLFSTVVLLMFCIYIFAVARNSWAAAIAAKRLKERKE